VVLLATEYPVAFVMRRDVARRPLDQVERQLVTGFIVIGPVDQPMPAQDETFRPRVRAADLFQLQSQVEAGALPRRPHDLVAVDLARKLLGARRGGNGDHGVSPLQVKLIAKWAEV